MKKQSKTPEKKTEAFDFRTIKSFEDACQKENMDPTALPDVSMLPEGIGKSIIAVYKLFIVYQAINNGWEADYGNARQVKYYPWLSVLSSGSGFGFSGSGYYYTNTSTIVGSRLCTDTSEKAMYIGEQFAPLYEDFFLKK